MWSDLVLTLEVTGVIGVPAPPAVVWRSRVGEVGELRSLEPCESFVRFFLRKPNEGMRAAVVLGERSGVLSLAAAAFRRASVVE